MPLQDWMKIISVDDHVIEHPRVWQDRLPEALRAEGPQIVETAEGHHVWQYEGQLFPQIGLNAVAGKPPAEYGMEPVRYDQMIPGCYDPVERVRDMDIDGVEAALAFPSFPGFGGGVFQRAKDKTLALECVRAWNDFQVDEWCATAPDRLIPLGILPTWDVELAAREVERLAQIGTRAVSFPDSPCRSACPRSTTRRTGRSCGTPSRPRTCRCACTSVRAATCPASPSPPAPWTPTRRSRWRSRRSPPT